MYHDAPMVSAEAATVTVHRRSRAAKGVPQSERIRSEYELSRVVDFVLTYRRPVEGTSSPAALPGSEQACCSGGGESPVPQPMLKIALQFPDHLLEDATAVVHQLESMLHADPRYEGYQADLRAYQASKTTAQGQQAAPRMGETMGRATAGRRVAASSSLDNPNAPTTEPRLFALADNTFGSCCPDEITALHYDSDCLIHFGEACMSRVTRLPVLYIHPPLRFRAVAASPPGAELHNGAASLLAAAIGRAAAVIRRRRDAVNAAQAPIVVAPRLVIVGTPATAALLTAARVLLTEGAAPVPSSSSSSPSSPAAGVGGDVPMDWCWYDKSRAGVGVTAACAGEGAPADPDTDPADVWTVNGACFPRLGSPAPGEPTPLQHFLFVGPSTASHPVHLQGVHQYNMFHYTAPARAYMDDDAAAGDGCDAPVLFHVDEHYAAWGEGGRGEEGRTMPLSGSPQLSADASLADARRFLAEALMSGAGDDVASSVPAATGFAAPSARVLTTVNRRLAQRSFHIAAVRASSAVGILVASLAIEGYYECTMLLHQLLRAYGKRSYVLYVGHLNEFKLANFADTVDCFVVVACPNARHCHFPDKSDNYMKSVVSPAEVLLALASNPQNACDDAGSRVSRVSDADGEEGDSDAHASPYGMPGLYSTELRCILAPLQRALEERRAYVARMADVAGDGDANMRDQWRESAALIRMAPVGGGALVASSSTVQGSLARLHERAFTGLNPQIGQTEVQAELIEGKHGIARGYATERESQ